MTEAYLLVSHGSRDPRPQVAIDRLIQQLRSQLPPSQIVDSAQLELAELPLHAQICDFVSKCELQDGDRLRILPLFLIAGAHAIEDIPAEVAAAKNEIGDRIEIEILPFLGSHAAVRDLFARNHFARSSWDIILAHGSRRPGGNTLIEELAAKLDLPAAYWSVAPSLTDRVAEAIAAGANEIAIWPYFLFAGGITDAIAQSVAQLQQQYPQVKLSLATTIGDRPELVGAIAHILAIDS